MKSHPNRIALRTSLLYAAVAGLWILLSDRALEAIGAEGHVLTLWQSVKGGLFVVVTAALLYASLRAQLRSQVEKIEALRRAEEARARSLAMMASTIESTADGILVVDNDGRIELANRAFARMWALPADDLAGRGVDGIGDGVAGRLRNPAGFRERFTGRSAQAGEESFDHLECSDGRTFECYSRPQQVSGQVVGRVWSFREITERRRSEASLGERNAQLTEALRIARLAYWEYDVLNDRFVFNDQFYALLRTTAEREGGYTMSSGQYARRFVHPDEVAVVAGEIGQALDSPDPNYHRQLSHRIIYADGEIGYFAVHIRIRKDAAGRTVRTFGANLDITELKRAEEQARHLANFPELNPNPVLEFDRAGRLVYYNPAALAMAAKVGAADVAHLVPAAAAGLVVQCLASGEAQLRLETLHGPHTLSWSYYPIASQQVVHCYVGDISERKQLEEQVRQAQKMEAIGQLAGGVAHDFNNLLTAITGHLSMLRGNPAVTPEIAEALEEIGTAANRAAALTSQLLAFGRRQVISASPLDLNEVVVRVTKMLRRILGENIAVQVETAPGAMVIQGDAGMMDQVLLNLAVNARDAMPAGGSLRIVTAGRTQRQADGTIARFVRLSVSDGGTGISPDVMPRIFEPFFTTKEVGKGTGLGLATVFGIVQQHQGKIYVESEPGHGTTFHVDLPRIEAALATPGAQIPPAPRGHGETILLVEDEPAVREVGTITLQRHGYQVLAAASGPEALELWARHQAEIALLFTDLIMPGGISGIQLARRLLQEKPALRVLYTSGYSTDFAGRDLTVQDGINYLAKPYELDRLFRMVRSALEGAESRAPF
ncbi:MAG TPA: ATP-binding protein [Lacunisphaera sp.]|nr:ATP-binding protein [Lacunisphaera sp.]